MPRRVAISGLGAVTGFGYGVQPLWQALLEGRSAIRRITLFDPSGFPSQAAAEVQGFSAKDHVPKHYRKAVKVMARDIELAVGAAKAAVEHAGIVTRGTAEEGQPATYPSARIGCSIGAGLIAAEIPELTGALASATPPGGDFSYADWGTKGMDNLTPLWLLKYLPNMLACHVTIIHDARGPSNTITCGEASGALSIGEALRVIERDDADLSFAGGAESKVNLMGLIRLQLAGRLAPVTCPEGTADTSPGPAALVRPFDPAATGTLLGEGAGILLLERSERLAARAGNAIAMLEGFGAGHSPMMGDAAHRAEGLIAAIESALDDAEISPADIDAIVPHACGYSESDDEEAHALRTVFGPRLAHIPLITLCPNIGETMAGSGGLAAAVASLCLQHQQLPARLHAGSPAPGFDAGPAPARPAALRRILVCTNSLGGQNAALVIGRAP